MFKHVNQFLLAICILNQGIRVVEMQKLTYHDMYVILPWKSSFFTHFGDASMILHLSIESPLSPCLLVSYVHGYF